MRRARVSSVPARSLVWSLIAAAGCGDGDGQLVLCGPGTTERNGRCVVAEGDGGSGIACGPDTIERDGVCIPDPDYLPDAGLACGPDTIELDGRCVPDPDHVIACGAGTIRQGNECVPKPTTLSINGLKVTQLSLSTRQGQVDGTSGHDTLTQYYPVDISIGVTYQGDAAKIPLRIQLTKPDASAPQPGCALAGLELDHPGGATPTETIASVRAQVPRSCLDVGEGTRTVTPLILIDPDRALQATNEDAVSRAVAFHASNTSDADLGACRRDPAGTARGDCALELKVIESTGLDFEISSLSAESSVMVVDKCGDVAPRLLDASAWTALLGENPSALDIARPVSYRCNSAIVPEFAVKGTSLGGNWIPELDAFGKPQLIPDSAGNPTIAYVDINGTKYPSYLYGGADLALAATVVAYGQPSSDQTKYDDAQKALGSAQDPIAHNALPDVEELRITYRIRPSRSGSEADFRPLYIHHKNDQAKATPPGPQPPQDAGAPTATDLVSRTAVHEEDMVPAAPSYFNHGLYLENDCGEKNKLSCNSALNPRDEVIYGAWKDETDFTVRACVMTVKSLGPGYSMDDPDLDTFHANDCKDIQVRLVRNPSMGRTQNAASYDFNKDWSNVQGSTKTISLVTSIYSHNHLDTQGATSDNQASLNIGSSLLGSIDVLRGWGKAAGYVSVVGSYYDYGISAFGQKFWGESKQIEEYHWERDFKMSKEQRWGFRLWAGVIPISIYFRIYGEVGLSLGLDVVAVSDGPDADSSADADGLPANMNGSEPANSDKAVLVRFPGSQRIGLATVTAKPYGLMKANAGAAIDLLVVRAGVAGELTLLDLKTPMRGYLAWGATSLDPVTLRAGVWADIVLDLTVMRGRIYVYLEHWGIWGCGRWCLTSGYRTFWDYTIASWSGWSWSQTLWSTPFYNYDVKL